MNKAPERYRVGVDIGGTFTDMAVERGEPRTSRAFEIAQDKCLRSHPWLTGRLKFETVV